MPTAKRHTRNMKTVTSPDAPMSILESLGEEHEDILTLRRCVDTLETARKAVADLRRTHDEEAEKLETLINKSALTDPDEIKEIQARKTQLELIEIRFRKAEVTAEEAATALDAGMKPAAERVSGLILRARNLIIEWKAELLAKDFSAPLRAKQLASETDDATTLFRMMHLANSARDWSGPRAARTLLSYLSELYEFLRKRPEAKAY